jgi:hypothetical protein
MDEHLQELYNEVVALLEKSGFKVKPKQNRRIEVYGEKVNPAEVRSKIAEILSTAGFQGYYLKETYAYMGSKRPWRTDTESHVEVQLWPDFAKVQEQAKVAHLNRTIVLKGGVKITPLASR